MSERVATVSAVCPICHQSVYTASVPGSTVAQVRRIAKLTMNFLRKRYPRMKVKATLLPRHLGEPEERIS